MCASKQTWCLTFFFLTSTKTIRRIGDGGRRGGGGMDEGEEGDTCEFAVDLYLNIFITESA